MDAPLIGITTYSRNEEERFCLPAAYVDAVRGAGGVPVLLPPGESQFELLLEFLDGVIFAGGGDIDPAHYGGEVHPRMYMMDAERDRFELELARRVLRTDRPVLGICRGSQVLNVACGGDLHPHLPEEGEGTVKHREAQRIPAQHAVRIDPRSRLAEVVGETEITVTSWHHQAVRRVAPGWRVVAWAPDGTVEALEYERHPWAFAVQWHPELSPESPPHQRIFQALVRAAREQKQKASRESPLGKVQSRGEGET